MAWISTALIEITVGVLFLVSFWLVFLNITESSKLGHYFRVTLNHLFSWLLYVIFMSTTFSLTVTALYILKYFGLKGIPDFFFAPHSGSHFYLVMFFYRGWLPFYRQFEIKFSRALIRANIYFFVIFLLMLNLPLLLKLIMPNSIVFTISPIPFVLFSLVVSILFIKSKFEWSHVANNFRLIALSLLIILMVFGIYHIPPVLASFL